VDFMSRIGNPIASSSARPPPDDALALVEKLDPTGIPGRLTLVSRMGNRKVRDLLPPIVRRSPRRGTRCAGSATRCTGNIDRVGRRLQDRHFDG